MLIQDFIVKEKKVSGLHKDLCEDCKRVEYLYRNLPGYKSNLVFWVAKPCQSILKKPRPVEPKGKLVKDAVLTIKKDGITTRIPLGEVFIERTEKPRKKLFRK